MEVASEKKRENTSIIAGPGPQWPSVWFMYVPKSMEPVSAELGAGGGLVKRSPTSTKRFI